MQLFDQFWAQAVAIAWGLPLVILLLCAGIYFTVACRFIPFFALAHTIQILLGRFDDIKDPGQINHFQALSSALSATIGMGNIAGVAIAITTGGPGCHLLDVGRRCRRYGDKIFHLHTCLHVP